MNVTTETTIAGNLLSHAVARRVEELLPEAMAALPDHLRDLPDDELRAELAHDLAYFVTQKNAHDACEAAVEYLGLAPGKEALTIRPADWM